jgi:hypothetical protein
LNEKHWKWFGRAAHFICGNDCRFHMATQVGNYLISTVGEYLPDSQVREIMAKSRGIKLEGKGDAREAEFLAANGYEDIGYQRKYETMVFLAGPPCRRKDCGCGVPKINGRELDFKGYNTAKDATEGHMELCLKWSKKKPQ